MPVTTWPASMPLLEKPSSLLTSSKKPSPPGSSSRTGPAPIQTSTPCVPIRAFRRCSPKTLASLQFVEAVESRLLVAFGQRGIVEDRVHEVIHRALEDHHGLTDVHQLRCLFTDDVHAQDFMRLAVENNLQAPGGIAADLPAGRLAIISQTHFVGNRSEEHTSEL